MANESSAKLDIELDDLELDITNSTDSAEEDAKELSSGLPSVPSDDDIADIVPKHFNDEDIKNWDNEKIKEKLELAIFVDSYDEVVAILTKAFPDTEKRIEILNTFKESDTGNTLLHSAAGYNKLKIVKYLLDEGADPNVKNDEEQTPLHAVCDSYNSDEDISEVVKILIEKGSIIDGRDESQRTPLHEAAKQGFTGAVQILLQHNADMEAKDNSDDQPIHEAAYYSNFGAIKLFVEAKPECVHWKGSNGKTPLHLICTEVNKIQIVKFLMDKEADVNAKDDDEETPLCSASEDQNNTEVVKLLLGAGADVNPNCKRTPLQRACNYGCSETVSLLLKSGAKIDPKALEEAVTEGYEDIVKQLIRTPRWAVLLRHTFKDFWSDLDEETTPFREMIRKMPDVAEEILDKCIVADPDYKNIDDSNYNVLFNYEFIEDIGNGTTNRYVVNDEDEGEDETDGNKKDVEKGYGVSYNEIRRERYRRRRNYTTSWGPQEFSKKQHPLAIMVESKRLNLLTHPVVGSLLHRKWLKFGQYGYFINLFTYCIFLIFLTTFALIIENPRSQNCVNGETDVVSANASENENGTTGGLISSCNGISGARRAFIYISAVIVILSASFLR